MKKTRKSRSWTKEQLEEAVRNCDNFSDVIRKLNLRTAGGNWKQVKYWITEYQIDTSHFSNRKCLEALLKHREGRLYTDEEVFCINPEIARGVVRRRARTRIPYKCKCENIGFYNGEPLVLQLDHINGNPFDHRIENLRYLCPNCHSQTKTWGNKNVHKP